MAGHGFEVAQQLRLVQGPEADLFHGGRHVLQPGVVLSGADPKTFVPGAQAGTALQLFVGAGTAPELGEEQAEPLAGAIEILRIERAEHFVRRHLGIEPLRERLEKAHATQAFVHALYGHCPCSSPEATCPWPS